MEQAADIALLLFAQGNKKVTKRLSHQIDDTILLSLLSLGKNVLLKALSVLF